jgi:hypothetical protein
VAFNPVNTDDTADNGDHLDELLRGFQTRNDSRSDPNYVLEPVDFSTSISERFVKILRDSSPTTLSEEVDVEEAIDAVEPDTNSGLIQLAHNYEQKAQSLFTRSKIYTAVAFVILAISTFVIALLSGFAWGGLISIFGAGVFIVLARLANTKARNTHQISQDLMDPKVDS